MRQYICFYLVPGKSCHWVFGEGRQPAVEFRLMPFWYRQPVPLGIQRCSGIVKQLKPFFDGE